MPQVSFVTAFTMGVIFEGILYGIFIPLLFTAGYVQWKKRLRRDGINKVMLFATVFYGLTITLHWVFTFLHGLRGVLFLPPGEDMETFFRDTSSPLVVSNVSLLQVEVLVGYWILIYRLYRVYARSLAICVVPLIGSLGYMATIPGSTIEVAHNTGPTGFTPWTSASFGTATFNSLCISGLIAAGLWKTHHTLPGSRIHISTSPVFRIMCIFVESAALWTTFILVSFILFLAKSNLRVTFLDMTGPAIGISFCLVIFRLGSAPKQVVSLPPLNSVEFVSPTMGTAISRASGTTNRDQLGRGLRSHQTER